MRGAWALLLLVFALGSHAWAFRALPPSGSSLTRGRLQAKNDLFADDLFDDDFDQPSKISKGLINDGGATSKLYMEESWKLSPADQAQLKTASKDAGLRKTFDISDAQPDLPIMALMYEFRPEFVEGNLESSMADHNNLVKQYSSILVSEVLRFRSSKGICMLWVGKEGEKAALQLEMKRFMANDPLLKKDYVARWDMVDFDEEELQRQLDAFQASEGATVEASPSTAV